VNNQTTYSVQDAGMAFSLRAHRDYDSVIVSYHATLTEAIRAMNTLSKRNTKARAIGDYSDIAR